MFEKEFNLDGKVAIVTGGAGVLGSAMSRGLADAGANVVVIGRNGEKATALASELPGDALGLSGDVLDKASLEAIAQQINDKYGRVDILLNAAGGNHPDATAVPGQRNFFDLPEEAIQWVFNLNFIGSLLPSQVFGKFMVDQGSGSIINISSMASQQAITRVVAYSGAKAAIDNFTRWLSVYMAQEHSSNIRVNAIAPGFFIGEQNRYLLLNEDESLTARGQTIINNTPMGKFGEPEDLIGTTLWLASDASRFVTGIVVPVDGGFSAFSGV